MNKIISGLIVAASAAFVSPVAFACDPMHGGQFGENIFAAMDANKDGVVSKKEFEDFQNEHFKEMDSNHDGKITIEEFDAAHHAMSQDHCDEAHHGFEQHHGYNELHGGAFINKRFDAADTNHDGALSREEAKSTPMILEHFDEIDSNKDGKVTEEELKSWMAGHNAGQNKDDKTPEKK